MVLDLVALNREPRVVAAVISRHVIVFESKNIECQPKPQILVTIIGEATGPETLGLGDIGGFFDSGWHIGANEQTVTLPTEAMKGSCMRSVLRVVLFIM